MLIGGKLASSWHWFFPCWTLEELYLLRPSSESFNEVLNFHYKSLKPSFIVSISKYLVEWDFKNRCNWFCWYLKGQIISVYWYCVNLANLYERGNPAFSNWKNTLFVSSNLKIVFQSLSFYFIFFMLPAKVSSMEWNSSVKNGYLYLVSDFKKNVCNFSSLSIMFAMGFWVLLSKLPSILSWWRAFIITCIILIFIKCFLQIYWDNSVFLLLCWITLIEFLMLNHPWISGIDILCPWLFANALLHWFC